MFFLYDGIRREVLNMKILLKILLIPVSLVISLFVWLCAGLISCSTVIFKLASGILTLLALLVLVTYSVKNGIILLVIALLVSPVGLPLLAVKLLDGLISLNNRIKVL